MHVPARFAAALLLASAAAPAALAVSGAGCPRGDAWSLSVEAERELKRGA
jgi:hypothetical protein